MDEMEPAVLDVGEMVHVIERRQFDTDVRRHFFGSVDRVDTAAMRVTGYAFVYDPGSTTYVRSNEKRTRVIPFTASGLIINVAPIGTILEDVRYEDQNGQLMVTDHGEFSLGINEFGFNR